MIELFPNYHQCHYNVAATGRYRCRLAESLRRDKNREYPGPGSSQIVGELLIVNSKIRYFFTANGLLIGNLIANFIGGTMADEFLSYGTIAVAQDKIAFLNKLDDVINMVWLVTCFLIILWYERPVRTCLKKFQKGDKQEPEVIDRARKRILNAPYFVVCLNFIVWTVFAFAYWWMGIPLVMGVGLATGLITLALAFFWVEYVAQALLIPLFFPNGGLNQVSGVWSVGLRGRLGALVFAVSIVPLAFIHLTISRYQSIQEQGILNDADLLMLLENVISMESLVFIAVAILLSFTVSRAMDRPLTEITKALNKVVKGDLTARARIYSRDEIGFAGETLNLMAEGLKEKEFIRRTFGRYVGESVRDEILKGDIPLNGELKDATILFADLREFTPLVENTPPAIMVYMLNAYLDEMTRCIEKHKGLVLQFIGDEIEAVFGAPKSLPGHQKAAVSAALEMRTKLELLNRQFHSQGYARLRHGIGIHTGQVLAANIGNRERTAYSLIGDTVNTASRIQGMNKTFRTDILVSSDIVANTGKVFKFTRMPKTTLKGKLKSVSIFSI